MLSGMTSKQGVTTPAPANQIKQQQLLQRYNAWKPKFPNVVAIDAVALKQLIDEDRQQAGSPKVVLVDVRAPAEQEVSIIPSRCTLMQHEFDQRKADFNKDDVTVVTYCTAGYRSGVYAEKLIKDAGFKPGRVMNLEGSILAWTLYDLPVVKRLPVAGQESTEQQTRQVHTCMADWAQYLNTDYEAVSSNTGRTWWSLLKSMVWG